MSKEIKAMTVICSTDLSAMTKKIESITQTYLSDMVDIQYHRKRQSHIAVIIVRSR